jgi:phosphatidylglycerophosphatase C
MGVVVAAFDVDGTLTVRDCVVPFLTRMGGGRTRLVPRLARRPIVVAGALARRDRDALTAAATRAALAGQRVDRVTDEALAFAGMVATSWLRADTVARLRWHRGQGHRVVLVSASYEIYVAPLGASLGADASLASRLEVAADGTLTGALDGPNCRAEEKVARLRAWQAATDTEGAELWAYGDSAGDDAMLGVADHAVRVGDAPIAVEPT